MKAIKADVDQFALEPAYSPDNGKNMRKLMTENAARVVNACIP
jgi:hypothetical protein